MLYRAVLIDSHMDDIYHRHSLEILLNKIVGKLLRGEEYWAKHKEEMYRLAKAVQEIEPQNPSSFKILAALDAIFNDYNSILKHSEIGLQLDSTDRDLRNLWFYAKSHSSDFEANSYAEQYKLDDQAQYWIASYFWRKKDRNMTVQILKNLSELFPDKVIYKKSYSEAMIAKDFEAEIFSISIPLLQESW